MKRRQQCRIPSNGLCCSRRGGRAGFYGYVDSCLHQSETDKVELSQIINKKNLKCIFKKSRKRRSKKYLVSAMFCVVVCFLDVVDMGADTLFSDHIS